MTAGWPLSEDVALLAPTCCAAVVLFETCNRKYVLLKSVFQRWQTVLIIICLQESTGESQFLVDKYSEVPVYST